MKKRYLDHADVDITFAGDDYTLDIAIKSVGRDRGQDYVDDWAIQRVLDPWGDQLPPDEEAGVLSAIGDNVELIEEIEEKLDEGLDDIRDIDYDGGHDA
jgi:hypothetical protein